MILKRYVWLGMCVDGQREGEGEREGVCVCMCGVSGTCVHLCMYTAPGFHGLLPRLFLLGFF